MSFDLYCKVRAGGRGQRVGAFPGLRAGLILLLPALAAKAGHVVLQVTQVQSQSIYCYDLQEMLSVCPPRFPRLETHMPEGYPKVVETGSHEERAR